MDSSRSIAFVRVVFCSRSGEASSVVPLLHLVSLDECAGGASLFSKLVGFSDDGGAEFLKFKEMLAVVAGALLVLLVALPLSGQWV